jgi:menaquinone-dependent protoporphyrinogen oxidase
MKVLVTAASMHGATAEIAQVIGQALSEQGLEVTVLDPGDVGTVEEYDAVVLGSAVYVGHWLDPAKDLVNRCRDVLATRPVWLFSSGPVGNPTGKLARAMDREPVDVAAIRAATAARDHQMFAGKLDPKVLTRPQRVSLLVFRGLAGDFRDRAEIRRWADGIASQLEQARRLQVTARADVVEDGAGHGGHGGGDLRRQADALRQVGRLDGVHDQAPGHPVQGHRQGDRVAQAEAV